MLKDYGHVMLRSVMSFSASYGIMNTNHSILPLHTHWVNSRSPNLSGDYTISLASTLLKNTWEKIKIMLLPIRNHGDLKLKKEKKVFPSAWQQVAFFAEWEVKRWPCPCLTSWSSPAASAAPGSPGPLRASSQRNHSAQPAPKWPDKAGGKRKLLLFPQPVVCF